jgi:WD40 repeat protein
MNLTKIVLSTILCACLLALSLPGQTITGAITGTVTDPSGAVVPNAKITATNQATNVSTDVQSNEAGVYNLLFLPIGHYTVSVSASGFKKSSLGPFKLEGNQTARVDIKLEVGDTTQVVEIKDVAPILQTETTQTGDTINFTLSRNIQEMDPAWSPDSKRLAYTVRPKEKAAAEIDVTDLLTKSTAHVTRNTPEDRSNAVPVWSKDGKRLAWTVNYANEKRSDICVADVSSLKTECLTTNTGDQKYSAVAWSPDGSKLLITSNAANGFDNVALLDAATKNIEWITQDKWEMTAGGFSPDGKRVVYSANLDGETGLYSYDLSTKKTTRLDVGGGVNSVSELPAPFAPDG